MQEDVREIVLEIVAYILKLSGIGKNLEENKKKAIECIKNGLAYKKFLELVDKQGGSIEYLNDIPRAKFIKEVVAKKKGFVTELNARIIR